MCRFFRNIFEKFTPCKWFTYSVFLCQIFPICPAHWCCSQRGHLIFIFYGLDGPGIEFRRGRDFLHLSRPALDPHINLYKGKWVCFLGVNWPGFGVNHPPPSNAEVKERVETDWRLKCSGRYLVNWHLLTKVLEELSALMFRGAFGFL
jgi:hypothetical protein